jgi:hypothetical protein
MATTKLSRLIDILLLHVLTAPHISLVQNKARELLPDISLTINLLTEPFYMLHINMFPSVQELAAVSSVVVC